MKVSIYRVPWNASLAIMFWDERNGKTYAAKPVILEFQEVPEGYAVEKPTLEFGHLMADAFLKALAEELDKQGIKTDSDAKIAGTLEATRAHLADMRQLLKLK